MCWWIGFGAVALVIGFVIFAARQQRAFEARILRDGRSARGWIVTAPPDLYEEGKSLSGAAHIVFSFDPGATGSDATLRDWAARVKEYTAGEDASDDEKWLADCQRTHFATQKLIRLPHEVSGDAEGYFTSVIIRREKLPGGKITRRDILLRVVLGEGGGVVMTDYPDAPSTSD